MDNLEGVITQPLSQFMDDRGGVLHMLRSDSDLFVKFGEIYFSEVNPGIVKAWKYHKEKTQFFAVPIGMIRLVIYDGREGSVSKGCVTVIELGRDNYQLVRIPPQLWYGFMGLGEMPSLIANCADMPHDPEEADQLPASSSDIPYEWSIRDVK
jgi:dTDP-4-dehydrorhamnose 3,5-epimerase